MNSRVYYLVAVKLGKRSFITAEPPTDDLNSAKSLARRYNKSPLWHGSEIVVLWNGSDSGKRISVLD